ncbi:MAG: RNA polymerase sigma factor, partial [Brevundimonas sp.]|nr:RNA polymerase sigma factor [Brevundimonas sp.]
RPLAEQDVRDWDAALIDQAERHLATASAVAHRTRRPPGPRAIQAAIHAAHCARRDSGVTPWRAILGLYDALLTHRDDAVIRTNRAVALAEVQGPGTALDGLDALPVPAWLPWQAARAEMLVRLNRHGEAVQAFDAALSLAPSPAERLFLIARRDALHA